MYHLQAVQYYDVFSAILYGSVRIWHAGAIWLLKYCWQALRKEWLVSQMYDKVLADHAQKEGDGLGLRLHLQKVLEPK